MLKIDKNYVVFENKFGRYVGYIDYTFNCSISKRLYYFSNQCGSNNAPLINAGFDTYTKIENFCHKLLHYYVPGGVFPYCKSREDVIKILKYLDTDRKNFIQLQFIV